MILGSDAEKSMWKMTSTINKLCQQQANIVQIVAVRAVGGHEFSIHIWEKAIRNLSFFTGALKSLFTCNRSVFRSWLYELVIGFVFFSDSNVWHDFIILIWNEKKSLNAKFRAKITRNAVGLAHLTQSKTSKQLMTLFMALTVFLTFPFLNLLKIHN